MKPLAGRRAVVTRARMQADELVRGLEALGAEVVHFPAIRVTEPTDPEPLRRAVRELREYRWIVFTSVNGVERFWAALREAGADTASIADASICAIGPATAAAVEREGGHAELVPPEHVAEAAVEALARATDLAGARILLPRAEVARAVIPDSLRARGAAVDDVPAYRTEPDGEGADEVRALLRAGSLDLITFTSGSTTRSFVDQLGVEIGAARVACIGPVTAEVARSLGLPVHIQADPYTVPGLIDAVRRYFEDPR